MIEQMAERFWTGVLRRREFKATHCRWCQGVLGSEPVDGAFCSQACATEDWACYNS